MARVRRPSPQTIAVLSALADEPTAWSYGYDLCRNLGLKAGTVYPILIRLAEREWVETAWEEDGTPGRPRRHLYRISPRGTELLAGLADTPLPKVRALEPHTFGGAVQ
jgi:DNA-binding PadR family transcriptional regulator